MERTAPDSVIAPTNCTYTCLQIRRTCPVASFGSSAGDSPFATQGPHIKSSRPELRFGLESLGLGPEQTATPTPCICLTQPVLADVSKTQQIYKFSWVSRRHWDHVCWVLQSCPFTAFFGGEGSTTEIDKTRSKLVPFF